MAREGPIWTKVLYLLKDLPDSNVVSKEDFEKSVEEGTGIVVSGDSVELPEDQTATDSLAEFIRFVFEEGYIAEDDIPVMSGFSRYLINTEPIHKDGVEMKRPHEVVPGVYIERNFNKEGIKRKIRQLSRSVVSQEF